MIVRKLGVGLTAFLLVSIGGAVAMRVWSGVRRVEHRAQLQVEDPAQAARVRELLLERTDALTSLYALTSFSISQPDAKGRMEFIANIDRGNALPDDFFETVTSVGRVSFALILEKGQRAAAGQTERWVTYSRQIFQLRTPMEPRTHTRTFRALDPPVLVVRELIVCEYHTEGTLMEPVLNISLQGDDVARLEELRTQYLNEIAKFKEAKRRLTSM